MNAKLLKQIKNNLTPLDTEDMYRSMLEECYGDVEVAGISFSAARILEELDPTTFRCGMVDYIDSLSLVEIEGDYYEQDAVEAEREAIIEELESELSDLEDELSDLDEEDEQEEISECQSKIYRLTDEIKEITDYCF